MKKLLTLKNVLKCAAVLFGLIAFFLMFAKQLYVELLGNKGYVAFDDAMFGNDGSVITFIGYLLVILASLGVCALVFLSLDEKIKKLAIFGAAFLLLLGAIFIFIEASVVNGNIGGSAYHLTAGPVFAGILAILAAVLVCASEFAPDKNLLK